MSLWPGIVYCTLVNNPATNLGYFLVSRSKTPIRSLSYIMLTDLKYDWSMIGPSNKDCLVTSSQSVANL